MATCIHLSEGPCDECSADNRHIHKLARKVELADELAKCVEMYQEAYYSMAAPPPPGQKHDPVEWARDCCDADALMTEALREYKKYNVAE